MEYVYAALMLHSAKKEITEDNVKKVLQSAGVAPQDAKVKALIASLNGVNIDEAIKQAAVVSAPVAAASAAGAAEKKEAPKEEKKTEEEAAGGLAALFG
jgi:large subunit ribosomal protein L12